jgi:hypothetical protein
MLCHRLHATDVCVCLLGILLCRDALDVVVTHVNDDHLDVVWGPEEFRVDRIAA